MTAGQASAVLTLLVVVGILAGPLFGEFAARHPMRRSLLVLSVIGAHALVWAAVLLVPPPAPRWLLVVLVVVIGTGGPGSMIGFDYARTFNPRSRQGAAVGIVNVGGFVASLLVAWAIGVVLGRAGGYTPEAFRLAWTVQYVVWAFAVVAVLGARRLARRKLAAEGVVILPLREALGEWRSRRRS
jgi:MFS family permease